MSDYILKAGVSVGAVIVMGSWFLPSFDPIFGTKVGFATVVVAMLISWWMD